MKGYVMQTQPFSVNDGEGIRTIIFLAGCPLRCQWCANPEGWTTEVKVGWFEKFCIGCGSCVEVCPQHIGINMNLERDKCIACGACVQACPRGSRSFKVSVKDVDALVKEIEKDAVFLRATGGGVTFSGGEATMQTELLDELSERLFNLGYSLAMETCGFFDFAKVKHILERMDEIFFDLKVMNPELHQKYTGVSNERILANAKRLGELPGQVVIRIPVVGGVNNDEANIRATARFVKEQLPKARMELLPYHKFGTMKYQALGIPLPDSSFYRPEDQEMDHLRQLILEEGVKLADYR